MEKKSPKEVRHMTSCFWLDVSHMTCAFRELNGRLGTGS